MWRFFTKSTQNLGDLFFFVLMALEPTSIKCHKEMGVQDGPRWSKDTWEVPKKSVLNLQGCHQLQQCHQCLWQGCSLTQNAWENRSKIYENIISFQGVMYFVSEPTEQTDYCIYRYDMMWKVMGIFHTFAKVVLSPIGTWPVIVPTKGGKGGTDFLF